MPPASPETQLAYLVERVRAVELHAPPWARPLRVWVTGYVGALPAQLVDELAGPIPVEVVQAETATVEPHRYRVFPPKGKRARTYDVECVRCGALGGVGNVPDETVPVYDRNGVMALRPVLTDRSRAHDPDVEPSFQDFGHVTWRTGTP